MSTFHREFRYWVAKVSDANAALTEQERGQLAALMQKVAAHREVAGKTPLECVVVESDWPIHDSTWAAVERLSHGLTVECLDKLRLEHSMAALNTLADSIEGHEESSDLISSQSIRDCANNLPKDLELGIF
ncbi:hypothetical protein PU634_05070 [Oceanimonas pelagia]|uniref:Uncharacterized protein n=1 Tax=Oceanimonas pelagia TaxID=3028314 RepID=A0AA50QD23_9GAMM|nr:hypothetical protein [Oceanimonas pelagia]WMC11739.1 hypothetical protein PU634_05070 [Oceanimonas pelagia]